VGPRDLLQRYETTRVGDPSAGKVRTLTRLLIVESPTKAKTLTRFLGDDYRIEASIGHIRDLPSKAAEVPAKIKKEKWGRMAVDVDHGFEPHYIVPAEKLPIVRRLRSAAAQATEILLATDPDREGEAISWHILEVLRTEVAKTKIPVRRIVFHELTKEAVLEGIAGAHEIDRDLVDAQEGRRILDRLYGYEVSPVLWRRISQGLSAGRVQSVAVRLLVEREEDRKRFKKASFWDIDATLSGDGREFAATLVRVGEKRVATGKDFDPVTGELLRGTVVQLDGARSMALVGEMEDALPWKVTKVEEKPGTQRPGPPFTTSSLQQDANRKFGYSVRRTMDAAQRLFQEGLITYHRTDSTVLAEKALKEAGAAIRSMYGDDYYTGPRRYASKVKNAQEAHEAIRPTDFTRMPEQVGHRFGADEGRLYELIWKRTVASQMAEAKITTTTLEFTAERTSEGPCVLAVKGKVINFPGFLRAYVEGSDDPDAELEERETVLPVCRVGDLVSRREGPAARLSLLSLTPKAHETAPPARYTEATLVKRLEDEGIGRPSTYAAIIETIVSRRGYAFRQGKALVPSFTAMVVTSFLTGHFATLVELGFTMGLEEQLDEISNGKMSRLDFLRRFYFGEKEWAGLKSLIEHDHGDDYPSYAIGADPVSGEPIVAKAGKFGPYVQRGAGGKGNVGSLPDDLAPADFTVEDAVRIIESGPRLLGTDPKSGLPVYAINGRMGPYVQLGETPDAADKKAEKPKRASIPKGGTDETVTLGEALKLLALPRDVGIFPDDNAMIQANFGRFGPYLKHGDTFRSLSSDDQVLSITLDEAIALLRSPRPPRGGPRKASPKTVLRELGVSPTGVALRVLDGKYGPYVTDGTVNATVPKGVAPDALSLDEALALLAEKAAKGPAPKKGRGGKKPIRRSKKQ
jgi:DNA topoisomerase-1